MSWNSGSMSDKFSGPTAAEAEAAEVIEAEVMENYQIFTPKDIAQRFHEAYERLAPHYGYKTREASAKPWEEVPENNRSLMMAVARSLIDDGVITPGRPQSVYGEPLTEIDDDFYIHGDTIHCRLEHEGTGGIVGRWTPGMETSEVEVLLMEHDKNHHEGPGGSAK